MNTSLVSHSTQPAHSVFDMERVAVNPHLEICSQNAFRTLGVAADATLQDILTARGSFRHCVELGVRFDPTGEWDRTWLGSHLPGEPEIEAAISRLTVLQSRLLERMFWIGSGDGEAGFTSPGFALHAQALRSFVEALAVDPDVEDFPRWVKALESWKNTVESDCYWQDVQSAEEYGGFATTATAEDIRDLRSSAFRKIFQMIINAAEVLEVAQLGRAERILALARTVRFGEAVIYQLEEDLLGPITRTFTALCVEITEESTTRRHYRLNDLEHDQTICHEAVVRYETEVTPLLDALLRIAISNQKIRADLSDTAALCLDRLAMDFQQAGEFEKAERLLERSASMAGGRLAASRVHAHLSTARSLMTNQMVAQMEIAGLPVVITRSEIHFGRDSMKVKEITGFRHSTTGSGRARGYHIALTNGRRTMSLDGRGSWAARSKQSHDNVNQIVAALWKVAGENLVAQKVREFKANGSVAMAGLQIDRQGMRREAPSYDLGQKLMLTCRSLLDRDAAATVETFLPWSDFGGHEMEGGHVVLHCRKSTWAKIEMRDEWNAVLIRPLIHRLQEAGLVPEPTWKPSSHPTDVVLDDSDHPEVLELAEPRHQRPELISRSRALTAPAGVLSALALIWMTK